MNQSAPLEELPEKYEEPDVSDVEAIPQRVLMQFIEELPAGYRTVFNLLRLKINHTKKSLRY